jgi:hypothetical protein
MKILVCGGRDYKDSKKVNDILDEIACKFSAFYKEHDNWLPIDIKIIHGGASGADSLAQKWAVNNQAQEAEYKAVWDDMSEPCVRKRRYDGSYYNALAGFKRNKEMLVKEEPDLIVAFPGGPGTEDMITQALKVPVKVLRIKP